jgi:four helix bundle protein
MFDFEKLIVYQKAREYNIELKREILSLATIDKSGKEQLRRAAMSIMLNIAEGSSRFSFADRRKFYVISRGSIFECIAIYDLLESEKLISKEIKLKYYSKAEELSKMLFTMIKNVERK